MFEALFHHRPGTILAYIPVPERRKRIVEAAIEVIAEHGLASATTRRIAERADAPLGALHYCFTNKNQLIDLIIEEGVTMLAMAFEAVDPQQGLEATIRADIEALWRWYRSNIGLQLALMELGMVRIRRGGTPAEMYSMWDRFGREIIRDHLEAAARADKTTPKIPIDEIVRFILHRFDGLTLEYAASRDIPACQRQIDLLADLMVQAALGSN
jgi:AcrR family transcriptional regulator